MKLLRALRYECFQMFFTKRWWAVPILTALFSWYVADDLRTFGSSGLLTQYHLTYNAWDVVMRSTQTWIFLFAIFAPLLVFIVGESYLRDRSSNTMPATLPRVQSRAIWWTAKVLSMFIGAFVYMTVFSLISLLVASFFYPFAWHFSSFQLHPELARKVLALFGTVNADIMAIPESTPLLFLLHMLLYSTLSFGTYAVVALVISLRVHKPAVLALIMLGMGLIEFYVNVSQSHLWIPLHSWVMQTRLSYLFVNQASTSFLITGAPAYTLPTSILYYLVLSVLFWLAGNALIQHDDL